LKKRKNGKRRTGKRLNGDRPNGNGAYQYVPYGCPHCDSGFLVYSVPDARGLGMPVWKCVICARRVDERNAVLF